MFLKHLKSEQRRAFLSLAGEMLASDAKTTVGEISRLAEIRRELGIDPDEAGVPLSVSGAADLMRDLKSRRIALLELLLCAEADGRVSFSESSLLKRLCGLWCIDPQELEWMQSWSIRFREMRAEACEMIFGEF